MYKDELNNWEDRIQAIDDKGNVTSVAPITKVRYTLSRRTVERILAIANKRMENKKVFIKYERAVFNAIYDLAPCTAKELQGTIYDPWRTNVNVIEPLGYNELLNMLVKCKFVITDSGGLQEEGSFFNKRVIVCRKTTERPEGISTGHSIMCLSPKELKNIVETVNEDYIIKEECPYGDGKSAQRIEEILG